MTSIITVSGEKLFAQKAQANEQLDIDTFIFANVPGQDPTAAIDRNEVTPILAQQVHTQAVQQVGRINDNVVVYSTVLDSVTGDFEFNWVGLYSSVNDTLVAINHVPTTSKTATVLGVAGNTLNRNFGIEYSGIADLTGINVAPETWQLDFTARLAGMDELTRNLAKDLNGQDSFIADGFKVYPRQTVNTFGVLPGVGYVNGLRIELEVEEILIADSYPKNIYVEAYFDGDASSTWKPKHTLSITSDELTDYIDESGKQHYVVKLAIITAFDQVEDLRNPFEQDALTTIKRSKGYIREIYTVAEAKIDKYLSNGQKIRITERGGALFNIVSSATYPANTFDIIASDELPSLSIMAGHNKVDLQAPDFGIVGGLVDVNAFKRAVDVSNETSKDIQFLNKNYDFNNQNVMNGGLEQGQDIGSYRVKGIKGRTNFKNIGTLHCSGFIRSIDINYINCIQPIYMSGNIADIDIYGNLFSGCRRSISHNDSGAGVKISGGHIRHNECTSHTEDNFVGFVLLNKAPFVDDVLVEHNTIKDIQSDAAGTNIFSGILIGSDNHPVSNFNRNKANHNTILNCGQATAVYKNPSFGITVVGRDSEQIDNTIRDGKWLSPAYMKGNGNKQLDNKCHDNQLGGITMKIMLDTNESKLNVQDGNIVTGLCNVKPAMRMFGSGISINSQVDVYANELAENEGGLAFQATRSITIDGQLTIGGNFKATKGIELNTAGDVALDIQLISDGGGVQVIKSIDGSLRQVKMKGSIKCNEQALNVNWCEDFLIDGALKIKCNSSSDNVFIYTQNRTDLSGLSLHTTDKLINGLSDGLPVDTPIKLFAKGGGSLVNHMTEVNGFSFVTDRDFTQLFQFYADESLVGGSGSNKAKMTIANSEIDLNGKSGTYFLLLSKNIKKLSLRGVEVDGTLVQTVKASEKVIDTLLIRDCLFDNAETATVPAHTDGIVGKSIITDSKPS